MPYLDDCLIQVAQLSRSIYALTRKVKYAAEHYSNVELTRKGCDSILMEAERLVLAARNTVFWGPGPNQRNRISAVSSKAIPHEIRIDENGWLYLRWPYLLPRKDSRQPKWQRDSMLAVLAQFFGTDRNRVRYDPAVIVIRSRYPSDGNPCLITDHDNLEYSVATDCLALYVMVSDHPAHCSNYFCSAQTEEDQPFTEFFVLPQQELSLWLAKYQ